MKVLFLGDLHFGVKNDDQWIEESIKRTIGKVCDYVKANDVKYIVQTGDWFDVRRGVTHRTMEFLRTEIMPQLESLNVPVHVIVGNHDCQYKNTIIPNAVREHLSDYGFIRIHDKPNTVVLTDGTTIDMIPWYCEGSAAEINSHIKSSGSDYCVGHWELAGFYMYSGMKAQSGLEPDFLKKYKQVFSGHYHVSSQAANVYYVGTPYTLTANDENDVKGFVVLETSDQSIHFVDTNETNHRCLRYPYTDIDLNQFAGKSVRMIITETDKNLPKVETLLEEICYEFRTVNNINVVSEGEEQIVDINLQQGLASTIENYVNASSLEDEEKSAVNPLIQSLYVEALSL